MIKRTALVSYSAFKVFDVVNDVGSYSEFLPGCVSSTVFDASDTHMRAELKLGLLGVSASFITQNTLVKPKSIVLALESGPFKSFKGQWRFDELSEQASRVAFELEFAMTNPFTSKAVEMMLSKVSSDMVNAVSNELAKRYG